MDLYVEWTRSNPLLSAAIQFAVLGTLGEVLSHVLRSRRLEAPFGFVASALTKTDPAVFTRTGPCRDS